MTTQPYNILFLCTGNSARSILAEGLVNHLSHGRFKGYSAGSQPMGRVNPLALETLQRLGCDTSGMSSKSWDVYAAPDAPKMDFVITVCDSAAGETCPYWPGMPMTAHWGFPDPSGVQGTDAEKAAFTADVFRMIERRIQIFAQLPMATLSKLEIQRKIDEMGKNKEPA